MNGRWWESYLVRYFPGFVVGCVCVVVIIWKIGFLSDFTSEGFKLSDLRSYDFKSQEWILIALLGFLYTYIVSAPITIFHYFRMIPGRVRCFSESFWINWSLVLSLIIVFFFLVKNSIAEWILLAALSLPAFYVLLSQYFLLVGTLNKSNVLYFFNWCRIISIIKDSLQKKKGNTQALCSSCQNTNSSKNDSSSSSPKKVVENVKKDDVAKPGEKESVPSSTSDVGLLSEKKRDLSKEKLTRIAGSHPTLDDIEAAYFVLIKSRTRIKSSDYRETYSHLREHANAIFIFLLCLSLMFLFIFILNLYKIVSPEEYGSESGKISLVVGLVLLWILPNIYLWGFANRLESKFPDFLKYLNEDDSIQRKE